MRKKLLDERYKHCYLTRFITATTIEKRHTSIFDFFAYLMFLPLMFVECLIVEILSTPPAKPVEETPKSYLTPIKKEEPAQNVTAKKEHKTFYPKFKQIIPVHKDYSIGIEFIYCDPNEMVLFRILTDEVSKPYDTEVIRDKNNKRYFVLSSNKFYLNDDVEVVSVSEALRRIDPNNYSEEFLANQ